MFSRRVFIAARLDEDPAIPAPVKTALAALASMHDGHPYCHGCGTDAYGSGTPVSDCEELAVVAAIWKQHPDYEES